MEESKIYIQLGVPKEIIIKDIKYIIKLEERGLILIYYALLSLYVYIIFFNKIKINMIAMKILNFYLIIFLEIG